MALDGGFQVIWGKAVDCEDSIIGLLLVWGVTSASCCSNVMIFMR